MKLFGERKITNLSSVLAFSREAKTRAKINITKILKNKKLSLIDNRGNFLK